mgnify:CR=1 FL=1
MAGLCGSGRMSVTNIYNHFFGGQKDEEDWIVFDGFDAEYGGAGQPAGVLDL